MFCRNRSLKGESLWKSNASNLVGLPKIVCEIEQLVNMIFI